MTVAGKLAKDPSTAALVQLAQRIHENCLAEDKLAAQQQRAAAEETLKRLEGAEQAHEKALTVDRLRPNGQ